MLKKLFYASASILMLALAYHLGATTAGAQAPSIDIAWLGQNGSGPYYAVAVVGRTPYRALQGQVPGVFGAQGALQPIPGVSSVIAVGGTTRGDVPLLAMLANGDLYEYDDNAHAWTPGGNVFGALTPAALPTFGQLKAQYRK